VSSLINADEAVAFEPSAAGLDAVRRIIGNDDPYRADRETALHRYQTLALPGPKPGRGWRHDYDRLAFQGLRWTTGATTVPTSPFDAIGALMGSDDAGVPALATENTAGVVHIGARAVRPAVARVLPNGVVVAPYAEARAGDPEPEYEKFLRPSIQAAIATDRFAALAEAFVNCGAFVYVPPGLSLDKPIQLVFATPEGNDDAVFPRIVVILGRGARATVIERHVGSADAFICGTVWATVEQDAQLEYVGAQQAGESARVFMYRHAACIGGTARFHVAELGGTLVRSVIELDLETQGARGETSALFFNTGFQHVDLSTTTNHVAGNTTADTVVRTAATDRGQGRFLGNIAIRAGAHGADASLRDDALLLSKRAHIDSVPALEIAANDVKAFHGATVGSLDADALFYAQSRGIARADAVRMVALAFFEPAITRFPGETLRDEVRTALDHKIDAATEIDG